MNTPALYLQPNGGHYAITAGEEATSLPDGYHRIWLLDKYGGGHCATLTGEELATIRGWIDSQIGR